MEIDPVVVSAGDLIRVAVTAARVGSTSHPLPKTARPDTVSLLLQLSSRCTARASP